MKNDKKLIIGIISIIILISLSVIIYNALQLNENNNQKTEEELVDEYTIDNYKKKIANKYNLDIENIQIINFTPEHKEGQGTGVWFDKMDVAVPNFIKMKYFDKTITILGEHDDYLYDEFVEGLNRYYRERLENENLIVEVEIFAYASFFKNNDIYTINDSIIEKFIEENSITLIVQINNSDIENTIKSLIDKLNNLKKSVSVQVMSDISGIATYREQPNYISFDYYYVNNINYDYRYTRITPNNQANYIYYNNYYYSNLNK